MIYNELKQRGTDDFPFELYRVNEHHPKYEMAFHWHAEVELVRVLSGELTLTLDGRASVLRAGDTAIINSETVHGASPCDCYYECIVFNLGFLKTGNRACDLFIDDLLARNVLLQEHPTEKETVALLHGIFDEIGSGKSGVAFKVLGLYHQLLGQMQRNELYSTHLISSVRDEKKAAKLKLVLKFIRERFSEDITLDDMSAVAGLSRKYYCQFFKDATGTTPIHYLTAYRIERAARKLLSTDLSVTRIAYDCGFNDLSYFIKTFKTFKNTSPNLYRKH